MDALSEALARMLRRQDEFNARLARIEAALSLTPIAPPAAASPPPMPPPPMPASAPQFAAPPPAQPPIESVLNLRPAGPSTPPPLPPQAPSGASEPKAPHLETNIGLTLLNRTGAVTLVIGVFFLFKWAVDNQWIGPAGRVMLGVVAGFVTLWIGDVLWRRGQQVFAQGITGAGTAILYAAIYAGFGFYHLLPQPFAFVLMVGTTGMAAALALRYNAVAIAALGMFGAYLTPILLSTGQDHPWFLFGYVLLVDLGALALTRARSWRWLNVFAFFATLLLYCAWLAEQFRTGKELVATLFDLAYYVLFVFTLLPPVFMGAQIAFALGLVPIWHHNVGGYFALSVAIAIAGLAVAEIRRSAPLVIATFATAWVSFVFWNSLYRLVTPLGAIYAGLTCLFAVFIGWVVWWCIGRKQQARTAELSIVALNGIAYFGACYGLLNAQYHVWMGLLAVVVAGIHLGLAYLIWKAEQAADLNAVTLTLAFALGYLTLAIPIQFTAYRITMAWAVEGAALAWIGLKLNQERMRIGAAVVFLLVAIRLLTLDAEMFPNATSYSLIWNSRFLTFLVSAIALWAAAYWTRLDAIRLIYYIGGHFVLLGALTMEDLGWAVRNSAPTNLLSVETVSLSILWAVYAVILVALGVVLRFALNRVMGLVLIGIVVLKLYVFDVWQLARVFRITAFVALGALLLATSYLYSRYRDTIESWWKNENPPS